MILAGNQGQMGQQVLLASTQNNDNQQPQTIKFITSSGTSQSIASPTKTITFAQAQQMGLISSGKIQQILPSTPHKQQVIKFF